MAIDMILILGLAISTMVSLGLTRVLIHASGRRQGSHLLDSERHRKPEHGQISRLGGIAIFGGLACGIGFLTVLGRAEEMGLWLPSLSCAALMFGIGLIDDCQSLGAKEK